MPVLERNGIEIVNGRIIEVAFVLEWGKWACLLNGRLTGNASSDRADAMAKARSVHLVCARPSRHRTTPAEDKAALQDYLDRMTRERCRRREAHRDVWPAYATEPVAATKRT